MVPGSIVASMCLGFDAMSAFFGLGLGVRGADTVGQTLAATAIGVLFATLAGISHVLVLRGRERARLFLGSYTRALAIAHVALGLAVARTLAPVPSGFALAGTVVAAGIAYLARSNAYRTFATFFAERRRIRELRRAMLAR